jgi:putative flippase GtrA
VRGAAFVSLKNSTVTVPISPPGRVVTRNGAGAPTGTAFQQLLSFTIVGAAGFLVDAGTLCSVLRTGVGLYFGRVVSYLCAVTFTWAMNRRFTFKRRAGLTSFAEWRRFTLSQLAGASVNLGSYATLVHFSRFCAAHPVVAVGAGSLGGLLVNFLVARRYVFDALTPDSDS